ncbi:integrase catalytic domain-containing protein [Trichonephila clavipes]|nr:integrase catalytic domain-containing protein [Trichonephila clavipes]
MVKDTSVLKNVNIPRHLKVNISSELHVFVDAAVGAYAACVFVRSIIDSKVNIVLARAKCQRFKVKAMSSEPALLHLYRVADCIAFEIVGIDLAVPLFLRSGQKVWIAMFACGNVRAIHLELVNSLTADSFLLSFRCFIARRGRPGTI